MLLGTADDRGRDVVGAPRPLSAPGQAFGHEVVTATRRRRRRRAAGRRSSGSLPAAWRRGRTVAVAAARRSRRRAAAASLRRSRAGQPVQHVLAVGGEPGQGQAPDVLEHAARGAAPSRKARSPRRTGHAHRSRLLLARDGERRAGHPAGKEVDARVLAGIPDSGAGNIALRDFPVRTVVAQGSAAFGSSSTASSCPNPATSSPSD